MWFSRSSSTNPSCGARGPRPAFLTRCRELIDMQDVPWCAALLRYLFVLFFFYQFSRRDASACLCCPNEGRASFDLILCSAPPCRPCHAFFPITFDTVNIYSNLASSSAILSSPLFSCRTSSLRVQKPPFHLFPPLSTLSVLFLHTISLIHRHLALYHSQMTISECESFESSPSFLIRSCIFPSILSPL